MPRKFLMSPEFEGRHARWRKTYKGKPYSVTCAELGLSENDWIELSSYQSANAWWVKKRAEIDAKPPKLRPDLQEIVDKLRSKREVLIGLGDDASDYDAAIDDAIQSANTPILDPKRTFSSMEEELEAVCAAPIHPGDYVSVVDPFTAGRIEFLTALGVDLSMLDATSLEMGLGAAHFWSEKLSKSKAVAADRKVGTHLDAWLELKRASSEATSLVSLQGYRNLFGQLIHDGRVILSNDMAVDVIEEAKVKEVYLAIADLWGIEGTGKKKWDSWSNFVNYLAENRLISRPVNLDSSVFRFKIVTVEKPTPDMAQVRKFLDGLPDRFRLYALLAANCGMNNTDIAKLQFWTILEKVPLAMLDLDKRVLRRKRVKTSTSKSVPTVNYWLWDETVRLLKQEQAKTGPLVLLDAKDEPLMIERKGGVVEKASVYDKIKSRWRDHFGRGEEKLFTVSDFRDISSSLIQHHKQHRKYWDVFLGHSPRSVAGKNYATSEDVSHICKWLEKSYFPKQKAL